MFFWSQAAGVFNAIQVKPCGRKLRDAGPIRSSEFDAEQMRPDQFARRAFIHSEEMTVYPIPAVIAVCLVSSDSHPHLRLSPPPCPIGSSNSDVRAEVCQIQLAVGAVENDFA